MSLAFQLGLAYGLLAVLATAFSLLMLYWHFKKPVKKVAAEVIFFRYVDDKYLWYVQLTNGKEAGPFLSESGAKGYKAWFNKR